MFLKYPVKALICNLSHAEKSVLLHLVSHHFRFCHGDYDRSFYFTDRDLALLSNCSSRTVWLAKKTLQTKGLIIYQVGKGNKTWYKLFDPGIASFDSSEPPRYEIK